MAIFSVSVLVISINFLVLISFQFLKTFQFPFQLPFCHFFSVSVTVSVVVAFFINSVNMKLEDQFSVRLLYSDSVEVYT